MSSVLPVLVRRILALLALFALPANQVFGSSSGADPSVLCDGAAQYASTRHGVPITVMRAIMLTETGRYVGGHQQGWPWAVNQGGQGTWFDTRAEAADFVTAQLALGVRNLDLGCFQINLRWHGAAFASMDAMLDPVANADYAAALLGRLYAESGDWSAAAGAYHSATPDFAQRYRARFDAIFASLTDGPARAPAPVRVARANPFPLLQGGGRGQGGSLFPATLPGHPLIGGEQHARLFP